MWIPNNFEASSDISQNGKNQQNEQQYKMSKMQKKGHIPLLLAGLQIGPVILEIIMEKPQKVKNKFNIQSSFLCHMRKEQHPTPLISTLLMIARKWKQYLTNKQLIKI